MQEQREQLYLDRYSDSTIEDKLAGRADRDGAVGSNGPLRKIMEPMKELLKSESDYIQDLRLGEISVRFLKRALSVAVWKSTCTRTKPLAPCAHWR